jgi:DNA-directed RNA polymerase specialized sigma24 family protein
MPEIVTGRRPANPYHLPEAWTVAVEETPEKAATSIAEALDFLRGEANAAGLAELGDLIGQASATARKGEALSTRTAGDLVGLCRAIDGLPDDCRKALVFKKVYRYSCEEIARSCGVPLGTARARVIEGFRRVQTAL